MPKSTTPANLGKKESTLAISQVLLPVFTLVIFVVQFFTGFFITPEIQLAVLYFINMISRLTVGRDMFGDIKPIVKEKYGIKTKRITTSKTFWTMILGLLTVLISFLNSMLGIDFGFENIDLLKYSVPILSIIGAIVGFVTRKPVKLE